MKYLPTGGQSDAEADPLRRIATYAAEIALKSLVNDVRTLVKDAVLGEITPILDQGGLDAAAAASRKKALLRWFKSAHPLSLDPDTHPALIEAVIKPVNGVMALKAARPPSISVSKFVEDIVAHCNAANPRRKPPFVVGGQFLHVTRAAIREVTEFATRQGTCTETELRAVIRDGFVAACHTVKINQVPWSEPPIAGRRGAPSTRMVHDVWMSLGAKDARAPPRSAAIDAHANTPAAIARRTSQNVIALDSRGDWSALEVTLKSFHTVLHKSVPPREISEASFETDSCESYITEASQFASAAYDVSKPIHLLAVIAGIACAGLLPKVFACKDQLANKPSCPSEYTTFIRNLDWISRESRSRGVRDTQIFVRMVTLYIINLYEKESPIAKRQRDKGKGSSNKKWVIKHSTLDRSALVAGRTDMWLPLRRQGNHVILTMQAGDSESKDTQGIQFGSMERGHRTSIGERNHGVTSERDVTNQKGRQAWRI